MGRDLAVSLVLLVAILAVYGQVVEHDFMHFDDDLYVYENPHVIRGVTWAGVAWAFTSTWASNWHPLTWLSHMLDCELFGLNAGYHHLTSLFLHILNSVLLYLVLRRMTGAVWRSAMVAALFGIHPLHVESVAWVAERKDVLSTLFFMLILWSYVRYAARPCWIRYGPVVGFLALGLAAKPMLVTVPFVLLLLDDWPLGRFRLLKKAEPVETKDALRKREDDPKRLALRLIAEKIPLFALALASSVMTFVAQRRGGAVASVAAVPIWDRIANALVTYVDYVGKMFWPSHLAVFYPPRHEISTVQWAGAAAVLFGVSALVFRACPRWRYLGVGWLWYLGTLVPVIGLVQVGQQSMADRYTYLPLIGLFVIVVWGASDLTLGWRHRRIGLSALAGIVLLGCFTGTRLQVGHWRTSIRLLEHTLQVTESNALAHNNLGVALVADRKKDEAITHYEEALRIDPEYTAAHTNLGVTLMELGRAEEAIAHYHEAVRIRPDDPRPYNNLAWIRATHPHPGFRDGTEAVEFAERACALWEYTDPNFVDTLAAAYAEAGRFSEAVATAQKALSLARSAGSDELVQEFEKRLQVYEEGSPYREVHPKLEEGGP